MKSTPGTLQGPSIAGARRRVAERQTNGTRGEPAADVWRRIAFGVCTLAAIGWVLLSSGCGPAGASLPSVDARTSTVTIAGDWDDVDAAVEVGAAQVEAVVLSVDPTKDPHTRGYQLKHISGRRIRVILTRADQQPQHSTIVIACTVEPLPDEAMGNRVSQRIALRLSDLQGKDVAPIRE